jgi:hypothetical protein
LVPCDVEDYAGQRVGVLIKASCLPCNFPEPNYLFFPHLLNRHKRLRKNKQSFEL